MYFWRKQAGINVTRTTSGYKSYINEIRLQHFAVLSVFLNYMNAKKPIENDSQLVGEILAGNESAFRRFIERYERLVCHLIFRLVTNPADQEEICQEVFIKLYKNLKNFRFECKLSTYVGKVSYNCAVNYLKKRKIPLYEDHPGNGNDSRTAQTLAFREGVAEGTPESIALENERRTMLRREIENLPPVYRAIITLYHLDEMSYREISEILGLPEGTVKSYIFRGRKLLKEKITAQNEPEELWI